jgi:hypothetical protein
MYTCRRVQRWVALVAGVASISGAIQIGNAAAAGLSLTRNQFVQVSTLVQQDPVDFGGVSIDDKTLTAYVYPVSSQLGTAKARSLLNQLGQIAASSDGSPKVLHVSIVDVPYSLAELTATDALITTREPWARDAAPYLAMWYVDPAINAVHVDVTDITPSLSVDVHAFGNLVRLGVQPRPSPVSRIYDSAPWWGGDEVNNDGINGGECTGGFAVQRRSNGHYGMLIAGHCYGLNDTVYQPTPSYLVMGTVTFRIYGGSNIDTAFVDTPGGVQGEVWTSTSTVHRVDTYDTVSLGTVVCTDGVVNGQNCNAEVIAIHICVTYIDGQTVCDLNEVTSTNGSWIIQRGDSGGPVYRYSGQDSGVLIDGTISGETGTSQGSTSGFYVPWVFLNSYYHFVCYYSC